MRINVLELIITRMIYGLSSDKDEWLDEVGSNKPEEFCAIVPDQELSEYFRMKKYDEILDEYNVHGIYQLGKIFVNTIVPMNLIHFNKKQNDFMIIGLFDEELFDYKKEVKINGGWEEPKMPSEYSNTFNEYMQLLEKVIANDTIPSKTSYFRKISINDVDKTKLTPIYYTEAAMNVRKFLVSEKTVPLSSVADVFLTKTVDKNKTVRTMGYANFNYPFDETKLKNGPITNYIAEKGDIILPIININTQRAYLFLGSKEPVYVASYMIVVKPKNINPEYLYLYLMSNTAQEVFCYMRKGAVLQKITKKSVQELPVIIPKLDNEKYVSDFNALTEDNKINYQTDLSQELSSYIYGLTEKGNIKPSNVEDVLSIEYAKKIKMKNESQLRTFLTDDSIELNTCFRGKAYKATLILAGSILEAVLIDWLSEIHHCNYFETDYIVKDKRGYERRADLIDYINAIKYIEKPNWMAEAKKAHKIREKRNLVHAKLCLKSDVIDEKVCKQVVGYLEDVLETRGIHQVK